MFTLIPSTYIPSMLIIPYVSIRKRTILIASAFLLGLATFLNGPSEILGMPADKLYLIMLGQALSGIFIATLSIPALPEMINSSTDRFDAREEHRVHSLCSGLYNASLGVGNTLGPIISSILFDAVGFRHTQDIIAMACIFFGLAYLIFGTGLRICPSKADDESKAALDEKFLGKASIQN